MNTADIIAELEAERDRLDTAIAALEGSGHSKRRGRPPGMGRRHMSAAARRKIGEAKRKWWAEQKKK